MFVDVGARGEFVDGVPRVVSVNGREVGVIGWGAEVFALRNVCPHQYAPVCQGHAMPLLVADADGEMATDETTLVVVCPWHGWEFDARTGRVICGDAAYRVKTYSTRVQDGRVLVDVGGPAAAGATPSAAVARRRRP